MSEFIKVTAVEPLEGYELRVTFSDGAIKEIDMGKILAKGEVFAPIRGSREVFEQVHVHDGTIEWPGEVDFDPEVIYGLYEPASGDPIARRTIREASNPRP